MKDKFDFGYISAKYNKVGFKSNTLEEANQLYNLLQTFNRENSKPLPLMDIIIYGVPKNYTGNVDMDISIDPRITAMEVIAGFLIVYAKENTEDLFNYISAYMGFEDFELCLEGEA